MKKTKYSQLNEEIQKLSADLHSLEFAVGKLNENFFNIENKIKEIEINIMELKRDIHRTNNNFFDKEYRRRLELSKKGKGINTRFAGRKGIPNDKLKLLKECFDQKLPIQQIIEKTGLSRTTIYKYKKNGFTKKDIINWDDL